MLFVLLLVSATKIFAQSGEPAVAANTVFSKFIQTRTNKTVVLFTNRDTYIAGEKIWFNARLINTGSGKIDLGTKNLFVDLVDEKDSIIHQAVLNNRASITCASFQLAPTLPTGFYWIRSYTAMQLQYHINSITLHPLYILNKQLNDEKTFVKKFEERLANKKSERSIHFFAERLTNVPGVISTGIIEVSDNINGPMSVNGKLVNSKDSVIASFQTNRVGLARLTFFSDPVEVYTAVFEVGGETIKYELPLVNNNSMQLSVAKQTGKSIKAIVTLEDAIPIDAQTTVLAVQKNHLYFAAVGTGVYGVDIPLENFSTGIASLLLFDDHQNLVSERKIYIPKEKPTVDIKPGKSEYSKRENVTVRIKVSGTDGRPIKSLLNVAVEEQLLQKVSDSLEANALPPADDFLLSNWINQHGSTYSMNDIDLLLATKGQALVSINKGLNKDMQAWEDDRKLLYLTGRIINKKGRGTGDRIVTRIATDADGLFFDADTTRNNGLFSLPIPQGIDSLKLALQVTDKRGNQMLTDTIKIENFEFPKFSTPLTLKQQYFGNKIKTLALLKQFHVDTVSAFWDKGWLAQVIVRTIKKEVLNYDASKRLTNISQIVTSDKFRYGGVGWLTNTLLMVPGVSMYYGNLVVFGPRLDLYGNITSPLIIMDGVPLSASAEILNSLNPADIDFIEVLRGGEAGIYGGRGSAGVISINTKHGPDRIRDGRTYLQPFTPITYAIPQSFTMPDYSLPQVKKSAGPDQRTAIYWKANITTDLNGETEINFYTGDNLTNYSITVTGLTEDGTLFRKTISIANTGKE